MAADDRAHMVRAVELAARGLFSADPNPRVGCVLVKNDVVVGEGWHVKTGEGHAEVNALRAAGAAARGATAYLTLEPCSHHGRTPPCADALVEAGVSRVVAAMQDPNPAVAGRGFARLLQAGIHVDRGLLEAEAQALNPGFVSRMSRSRPWFRLKLAMSMDGRTAMASGESQWITGQQARADVQRLRARSSAVMTGVATVLADDPSLNVRLPEQPTRQPLRVVLDPSLRMPATAKTLRLDGKVLVLTAASGSAASQLTAAGAEVDQVASGNGGLDLPAVAALLAERECNEVLVEAGARLAGALLQARLVDELVVYLAPKLLGHNARPLFELPGLQALADCPELDITDCTPVGRDLRITARVSA